jgi:hypothetical protein
MSVYRRLELLLREITAIFQTLYIHRPYSSEGTPSFWASPYPSSLLLLRRTHHEHYWYRPASGKRLPVAAHYGRGFDALFFQANDTGPSSIAPFKYAERAMHAAQNDCHPFMLFRASSECSEAIITSFLFSLWLKQDVKSNGGLQS